jgi:hypothetical protein
MSKVHEMMRECDNLATRHWQLEASGRGQSYKMWLNQVKKTVDFINVFEKKPSKNGVKSFYFFANRLESANTNASRRSSSKKVEKSREK